MNAQPNGYNPEPSLGDAHRPQVNEMVPQAADVQHPIKAEDRAIGVANEDFARTADGAMYPIKHPAGGGRL